VTESGMIRVVGGQTVAALLRLQNPEKEICEPGWDLEQICSNPKGS
jgi:hypothetical protein